MAEMASGSEQEQTAEAQASPVVSPDQGAGATRPAARRGLGILSDPYGLRPLIIGWCFWLLASWSITLAIHATVHTVRWMVFSASFGVMAVWPAVRLGQPTPGESVGRRASGGVTSSFLDWICLMTVLQVVIWPLMLVGRWTTQQTLWLDFAIMSWSLLVAAIVGWGRFVDSGWSRIGAMGACLLLILGEPVWMAVVGSGFTGPAARDSAWQMRISPIQVLWELTTTIQPYYPKAWISSILSTAAAGVLAWVVLGFWAIRSRRTPVGGPDRLESTI